MSQRTDDTFAVAVTVTPPAVADAVTGPKVVGDGVTHIHIGIPITTSPEPAPRTAEHPTELHKQLKTRNGASAL
uniref:hypothetical protein n=1 Tax=Streptomyces sp. CB02009 TaxID=1703938 RepID=UPI001F522736|nr:hypothetical protein [Streptomyces sp. CB02009]